MLLQRIHSCALPVTVEVVGGSNPKQNFSLWRKLTRCSVSASLECRFLALCSLLIFVMDKFLVLDCSPRLGIHLLWLRKSLKYRRFPYYFQHDNVHLSSLWVFFLRRELEKGLNNALVSWVNRNKDGSKCLDRWDSFTLAYSTFIIFIFYLIYQV